MTVESVSTPQDLNTSLPAGSDARSEGDNHIRNIKTAVKRLVWEHVGTYTASGASEVNTATAIAAFVAGYDYLIAGEGIFTSSLVQVRARLTNSGTPDTSSVYTYASAASQAQFLLSIGASNIGDSASEPGILEWLLINPNTSASVKQTKWSLEGLSNGGASVYTLTTHGVYSSTSAVNGAVIYPTSGTITGTFNMYRRFRPT